MKPDLALISEIIDAIDPKLKKNLDPKLKILGQKKPYLDESFSSLVLIDKIDLSHIDVFFESYPSKDILKIKDTISKNQNPAPLLKDYLRPLIEDKIYDLYPTLPYKYTSAFRGERLLKLDSSKMQALVQILGVYDIKSFLKTSIDQKLIADINSQLSLLEKQFLKSLQLEKEKVSFKKMPLETWDKKSNTFQAMKYLRGLNRLSKSIALETKNILNEIILRLPLKDKSQFLSLCTQSDESLIGCLYEELNLALDFLEDHFIKTKT